MRWCYESKRPFSILVKDPKHVSNKWEVTVQKPGTVPCLHCVSDREKSTFAMLMSIHSVVAQTAPHIPYWAMLHPA